VVACALAGCGGSGGGSDEEVVASGLNNPRKIFVSPGGDVYVAEAGLGGRSRCLGTGATSTCVGLTASITRIAGGAQTRVVTGLVSFAGPTRQRAEGAADVLVRDGAYYVLLQDAYVLPDGENRLGPDGATAGTLIRTPAGKASPTVVADLAAFEAAHNPDRGAGTGARFGNPSVDSAPYAFAPYRGGFAVADAAANDLLWISPAGKVSVLAVFPTLTAKLPPGNTPVEVQSVPTSVAAGPDGAVYVGELTGKPYPVGAARVWRVVPGKKPTVYAGGFTTISDLAFDGDDLLVLEIASKGLLDQSSPGALVRLAPDGTRTTVADDLVAPTGVAVADGSIYVSNNGTSPGTGDGPHGEVIRLPAGG